MKRHLSDVGSWMTAPALTIRPKASLFEAYNLMFENDVRRLPVVDRDGSLIGILTMSDVQQASPISAGDDVDNDTARRLLVAVQTVAEVMTPDPVTVAIDDTVREAAERMLEYEVSGLPVVEGDRVIGIITESDIFRLVVESWAQLSNDPVVTTHHPEQDATAYAGALQ